MPLLLTYLAQGLQLVPLIYQAGKDAAPLISNLVSAANSGTDPTPAEWQQLIDLETSLRAKMQAAVQADSIISPPSG